MITLRILIVVGLIGAAVSWRVPVYGAAPVVKVQRETTNIIVNFTGRLEASDRAEGPYTNLLGVTSPCVWPIESGTRRFWRSSMKVKRLAAGALHTIAVKADGTLWVWGSTGTDVGITNRPARVGAASDWRAAACGVSHTLAIKTNGTLWGWGWNDQGQLGIGTNAYSTNTPVQVGTDSDWGVVGAGYRFTMAVRADGTLWRWGLGIGQPIRVGADADWAGIACGDFHALALKSNGSLFVWRSEDGTNEPVRVGLDSDWVAAACGDGHCVALKVDGSLWSWGANFHGQLGLGNYEAMEQPTRIPGHSTWTDVSAGGAHTLALKVDGSLWAWGDNEFGQLGIGSDMRGTNQPARVGMDTDWQSMASGGDPSLAEPIWGHNVAVKTDGSLWSWGSGASGQLGIGTYTRTNHPVRLESDNDWAP